MGAFWSSYELHGPNYVTLTMLFRKANWLLAGSKSPELEVRQLHTPLSFFVPVYRLTLGSNANEQVPSSYVVCFFFSFDFLPSPTASRFAFDRWRATKHMRDGWDVARKQQPFMRGSTTPVEPTVEQGKMWKGRECFYAGFFKHYVMAASLSVEWGGLELHTV